jgi:hypothetical protein
MEPVPRPQAPRPQRTRIGVRDVVYGILSEPWVVFAAVALAAVPAQHHTAAAGLTALVGAGLVGWWRANSPGAATGLVVAAVALFAWWPMLGVACWIWWDRREGRAVVWTDLATWGGLFCFLACWGWGMNGWSQCERETVACASAWAADAWWLGAIPAALVIVECVRYGRERRGDDWELSGLRYTALLGLALALLTWGAWGWVVGAWREPGSPPTAQFVTVGYSGAVVWYGARRAIREQWRCLRARAGTYAGDG